MRKTNLFYLTDNTSNFLTFSNYGEYLTGVCLSTNHKIYPSSFICLNLDLSNKSIDDFKKFLMQYYENKLAVLRDEYNANNILQENLFELDYLLQAIYMFFGQINVSYLGDIVEHDYNGTYNDSICIVDFKRYRTLNIQKNTELPDVFNDDHKGLLYNWDVTNEIDDTEEAETLYFGYYDFKTDNGEPKYNSEKYFTLEINNQGNPPQQIKFNCIIPLFDINDLNYKENNLDINEADFTFGENIYKDIPYGIWFSNNGTYIELNRNEENISQSWSLVISSKFTPYPYGVKVNDTLVEKYTLSEVIDYNNNLDGAVSINDINPNTGLKYTISEVIDYNSQLPNAISTNDVKPINPLVREVEQWTYAELLAKQSEILKVYNEMGAKVNNLTNIINNIEKTMHEINALDIDSVKIEMQLTKRYIQQELQQLKDDVNERMNDLRWRAINTYNINTSNE